MQLANADESNSACYETTQRADEAEAATASDFNESEPAAGPVVNDLVYAASGDNAVDIINETEDGDTVRTASTPQQQPLELCPETSDDSIDKDPEEDLERSFQELLEGRRRIEEEELRREQIRHDLEAYVGSLSARQDEDGERLIEFPRNYKQILCLMTERDVREEDLSQPNQPSHTLSSSDRQKSWSRVLIQNGLAKQQAFGRLDEADDDADGESALSAKIAIKMARIRQLDAILEEKLGKNLYASTKTKKAQSNEQHELHTKNRTRLLSNNASSRGDGPTAPILPCPGVKNFIERNKRVVENGPNAKLTREEEERLRDLMRDADSCSPSIPVGALRDTPLFALDEHEREEIQRLIAEKRGVYQSALVPSAEEEETDTEKVSGEKAVNVIQETKRERLRKQRLRQIDEELEFLREHETVPILPDDDVADDMSDGCSTERSFMTTTSIMSTCSTRSGVTRRQLNEFVAAEIGKASELASKKASPDEIQNLLRSLSHVSISRPTTTV
ncbi:hypothetical protein PINS_up020182 [Pythium insidiosum]|nr:hypothetical protein PINS_up020182 [Pythium insidiosum]